MSIARVTAVAVCSLTLAAGAFALATHRQDMGMPQPGPQHAALLKGVGDWEGTLTYYMGTPDGIVEAATETVEAIGEFWIQAKFECDFMGMPYVGTGCVGYDTEKEKYVGTWIDNMSSYLAIMEGDVDEQTGKVVMRWTAPDMTGQMAPHRNEVEDTADVRTSTFYVGEGEESTKLMVISMKRKAAAKKPAR